MVGSPTPEIGIVDQRLLWILKQLHSAEVKHNEFNEQADQAYRFRDGKQLSDEDERLLIAQQRPINAFNTTQKFIRYVSGVQRDSYVALLFNAIDLDDTNTQLYGEELGKYFDWAMQRSNGNTARAQAFEDFLVTGMGWVNYYRDTATDPKGLVGIKRLNPKKMWYPDCEEINLGQSRQGCTRWRAYEDMIDNEEAKALFPSPYARFLIEQSDSPSGPQNQGFTWPQVDSVPYKIPYVQTFPLDKIGQAQQKKKDKVRIMEFQWWENWAGYEFVDPLDGTAQWMNEDEFNSYKGKLKSEYKLDIRDSDTDRQVGRKWQRAFLLNRRYLLEEPSQLPGQRFTFNPMCCHFDESKRQWYGFIQVLIDPQRYANKFFNQMIEIVGKSAKAGVMAETSAFEDVAQQRAFTENYAKTGSVSWVGENALKEQRIIPKPQTEVPQVAMAILDFCNRSMEQVTGISEASLGLGAGTQPGVMMTRRQRAGMVLLASEFDSESDFRREEGYIVTDYLALLADDRPIMVGNELGATPSKLLFRKAPFALEYQLDLDEMERDPNTRMYYTELLTGPLGQTLFRIGMFVPDMLRVLPLPRRWIEAMIQQFKMREQQAQQAAAQGLSVPGGRGQKKSLIELQAMVENKKADSQLKQAKAAALMAKSQTDAMKGKQEGFRLLLDGMKSSLEEKRTRQKHGLEMAQGAVTAANDAGFGPQQPEEGPSQR